MLQLVLPASTAKLANTDVEKRGFRISTKSTRFAQRLQHPRRQQELKSDTCVALLGGLVQQTLAADPCAVWDRLATGTRHCFERSLEGSVTANVASAPAPAADGQMDRPLPKQSRCTEGRAANSRRCRSPVSVATETARLSALLSVPEMMERTLTLWTAGTELLLSPGLTNAGTVHAKHQHLINDLSLIYPFNHPAEVENDDGVLRATSR